VTPDRTHGNLQGLDAARAHAHNAKWAAAEEARDREIAAEEAQFERETSRCRQCAKTAHPSSVCQAHRTKWGIPE
jgi:hypothetical protein